MEKKKMLALDGITMKKKKMWTAPDGRQFPLCKVWDRPEKVDIISPVVLSASDVGPCVALDGTDPFVWDLCYKGVCTVNWAFHAPIYEPSTRPMDYRERERLLGAKVKAREVDACGLIVHADKNVVVVCGEEFSYSELHKRFTFLDGSPIEVEE